MRVPSGTSDRYMYFVAVDATDLKTRETGLATWTVYRSRNGGASTLYTTPTINETDVTNMPGVYEFLIDEDTTLAAGNDEEAYVVHITHAGMAPVTREIEIFRPKITEGQTVTAANGAADADIERLQGSAIATPTVAGVLEVDVTHWIGTAAATPTVAGVPEVDLTHILGTAVSAPATAGILDVNVKNIDNDAASASGVVTFPNATLASTTNITAGTITTVTNLTNAPTAGDLTATMKTSVENAVLNADMTGHQTQGSLGQAIGDPAADTNTIYGAVVTGAAGATVAADIIAVKAETAGILADTNDIQTRLPAALGANGNMKADVLDIDGGVVDPTTAQIGVNVVEILTDTNSSANLRNHFNETGHGTILRWTAIATLASQTEFTLATGSADNNAYNGCLIIIEDAASALQKAVGVVLDYVGATKTITLVADPAIFTMAANDLITIIAQSTQAGSAPTAAEVADAVWDEDATAHQTGGTFGQAIGDPGADTNTIFKATVTDAAGATVGVDIVAVKAETASIQSDTDNIQTRLPAALVGGRMDSSVGAMAADTLTAAATAADFGTEIGTAVWATATRSITGLTAAALADFFDTDSGATYAGSVAGSVVKEIADNAGGSGLTLPDIADAVLDEVVEGAVTLRQSIRLNNAAQAGKLSGADTLAPVIRDIGDTKNRITATTDANGNRTAVSTDLT